MKKKIIIILFSILTILLIGKLYQSYALTSVITEDTNAYNVTVNNNSSVTVPANSEKIIYYRITNPNNGKVRYGVGYTTGNVRVKVYDTSRDTATGLIDYGESKFIKLRLINDYNTSSSVTISTILGYEYGGDLIVPSGVKLVDTTYYSSSDNLITLIEKKYNVVSKTQVVNNSVTYQYDTTNNLMADVDYNVRYYGASPNNYIYFNCSDYSNQSSNTCEVWRIIGIIGNKIKLIRNENIGAYSWDNRGTSSGAEIDMGSNDWTTARLMKMLNSNYNSETGGSLYWNRLSGTCYSTTTIDATKTCDMSSLGLKNDVTRDLIAEVNYPLRGYSNSKAVYANTIYNYERYNGLVYSGRPTSWTGKVALPYVSDTAYSADLSMCKDSEGNDLSLYYFNMCNSYNWLVANSSYWTMTPSNSTASLVWHITSNYSGTTVGYDIRSAYVVLRIRPVLHLDSLLEIKAGTGTSSSPYQLKVS